MKRDWHSEEWCMPEHIRRRFERIVDSVRLLPNEQGQPTNLEGRLVEAAQIGDPFFLTKDFALWTRYAGVEKDLCIKLQMDMAYEEKANAYMISEISRQSHPLSPLYKKYNAKIQFYRIEGLPTFSERSRQAMAKVFAEFKEKDEDSINGGKK